MRRLVAVLVALTPLVASAKDDKSKDAALPDGIKVTAEKGELVATAPGATARLPRGDRATPAEKLVSQKLQGDEIVFKMKTCTGMSTSEHTVKLAEVRARLENSRGYAVHKKKQYAEAAALFAHAVALWPAFDLAAVNLASALALQGKKAEAVAALVPLGKRNPAWLAWRLDEDAELAAVKDAPELAALVKGPSPGTATLGALRKGIIGHDAAHGLVATTAEQIYGPGAPGDEDLVLIDLASGNIAVRMPLRASEDYSSDEGPGDDGEWPMKKGAKAKVKAREAAADRLLRTLGVAAAPKAMGKPGDESGTSFTWPEAKTKLDGGGPVTVTVAGRVVVKDANAMLEHVRWAALVPGAIVVSWVWQGGDGCMAMQPEYFDVMKLPR